MQEYVDTLIVIPNQNLFRVVNEKTTFSEAFKMADSVLQSGVRGVTDLIVGTVSQGKIPEDQIQPEAGRGFRMDFGCINAAGRTQEMLVK